ncbi:hypothetical protein [Streptomyces chartreusis]|uniref:hypothetical protein n=1 Tax=Streptomyces chartreusis TaxID=1969 RepID=UPI00382ED34B
MSADRTANWTAGERLAAIVAQEINDAPAEELIKAATDEVVRGWAARIREVATAKGWSTWAAAFIDPDVEFVDTGMPSTESIVAELRRMDRETVLREAAAAIQAVIDADKAQFPRRSNDRAALGGARQIVLGLIDNPAEQPQESTSLDAAPLVVSRYDDAMEPALEGEPVFAIGAVAEDGRPVALCFDPETRRKVAGWLAPDAVVAAQRDCLALAVQFALQWTERAPVGLREGIEEILATMPTAGEKSRRETDSELNRLRSFAWATARRYHEIRARLATVDIRDSAEVWDLGMAIIAILEGPLDRDAAKAPRLDDFEAVYSSHRGKYRAADEYRCRKCGAIGAQGTETKTLADLIGMVLRHECLPRVEDGA